MFWMKRKTTTVKPKKKIKGSKQNGLTPIAPDEFFDGLDSSKRIYGQGGMMGQNISLGRMIKLLIPGNLCGDITGHWTPIPNEGDYLRVHQRSGNWGIYKIVNIREDNNVHDMFFADLIWLGYEQVMGTCDRKTFKFE